MRTIEEIRQERRLRNIVEGLDGLTAVITMPGGWQGSVIASTGAGWEHVSVCPYQKRITPTWDDMCRIKNIFFREDEAVIEIHPPKAEYVNFMTNCLHLWRCTYKEMVLPPSVLVGARAGQTKSEVMKELKEAYEMAGEEFKI